MPLRLNEMVKVPTGERINPHVESIIDPVWNFTDKRKPTANYSIMGYEVEEFLADNNDSISTLDPIFLRSKNKTSFLLYQDSYLVAEFNISLVAGGNANFHVVNTLAPLFKRVIYLVDEQEKTDVQNWHIGRYIKTYIEKYKHWATHATSQYYFPPVYDPTTENIETFGGAGFLRRLSHVEDQSTVAVKIPLKALTPLMEGWKKISIGFEHTLQLERNDNNAMIYNVEAVATPAQLNLTALRWFIPKIQPSPKARSIINRFMSTDDSINIGFCNYNVYKNNFTVPNVSALSLELPVNTTTYRPSYVWCVVQRADAQTSQVINAELFGNKHLNVLPGTVITMPDIEKANIKVNGERLMRNEYKTKFIPPHGDFQKLYEEFVNFRNKNKYGDGTLLNYQDFRALFQVIKFDLTKMDRSIFESRNTTDLVVEITVRNSSVNPLEFSLYTMVCSDRIMEARFVEGRLNFQDSAQQPL